MEGTAQKRAKWITVLIFLAFFAALLFEHRALYMGHDDYGYASLSYIGYGGPWGMSNTSFWNVLQFLAAHYCKWGGRVLYFFFEIILLRGGIRVYRLAQCAVILLIFWAMYALVRRVPGDNAGKSARGEAARPAGDVRGAEKSVRPAGDNPWLAALLCLCYGIIGLQVMRDSVFWITASVLYLWPLLPLFLFFVIYTGAGRRSGFSLFVCGLLCFMAAWSQEQLSVMAVAAVGLYALIRTVKNRRIAPSDAAMVLAAAAGFLVLMLAPGQSARMAMNADFYSLSLMEKLMRNVPIILFGMFVPLDGNMIPFFFLISAAFLTAWNLGRSVRLSGKLIHGSALALELFVLILTATVEGGGFGYFYQQAQNTSFAVPVLGLTVLGIAWMLLEVLLALLAENDLVGFCLVAGGILSEVCMVISPVFPDRSLTPWDFSVFFMIAACFRVVYDQRRRFYAPALAAFAVMSLWNFGWITAGYYRNRPYNAYNDAALRDVSARIKAGEDVKGVVLLRLPEKEFATAQPYEDGHKYIQDYIRWYYELPDDFLLDYRDSLN
jgi:hypothetical protein